MSTAIEKETAWLDQPNKTGWWWYLTNGMPLEAVWFNQKTQRVVCPKDEDVYYLADLNSPSYKDKWMPIQVPETDVTCHVCKMEVPVDLHCMPGFHVFCSDNCEERFQSGN